MKHLTIGILSLFSLTINAQNIIGKTTTDNKPLPYVNVYIKGLKKGAVSQDNGAFNITNVKAGTLRVIKHKRKHLPLQTKMLI